MTSPFGDLNLDSAPDDPNFLPDATYRAYLTDLKVGPTKSGDKVGATFTYTISEGTFDGRKVTEWKSAMPTDDERTKAYLKQRLLSLGVPADRISSVDPDDLIGKEVLITTKNRGDFVNVNRVTLADLAESGASNDLGGFGGM